MISDLGCYVSFKIDLLLKGNGIYSLDVEQLAGDINN